MHATVDKKTRKRAQIPADASFPASSRSNIPGTQLSSRLTLHAPPSAILKCRFQIIHTTIATASAAPPPTVPPMRPGIEIVGRQVAGSSGPEIKDGDGLQWHAKCPETKGSRGRMKKEATDTLSN